tara:strand:+ start:630 stop:842 length:213 start_codon:yes stop_codon:yes gene_type:complete
MARYATISKLEDGEKVLGSRTSGEFHVQEWIERDFVWKPELKSGAFFQSYELAMEYADGLACEIRDDLND